MTLKNDQYDTIVREYNRKQLRNQRELDERIEEVERKIPRIAQIRSDIASLSANKARSLLQGEPDTTYDLKEEIAQLTRERRFLLTMAGYPENYLDMWYECPICQDTGYVDGQKCACFRKASISLLYEQSHIQDILEKENFHTFSFDYYSDTIKDEKTRKTPLEHARFAVRKAQEFIEHFGESGGSLFIYGDTGVGKTFLTHCIAYEIINRDYSVLYFSAYDLFQMLAAQTFGRDFDDDLVHNICDADLLIIDDLGTELTNAFVSSQLFMIVNERLTRQKSTIISTNYDTATFAEVYSTRTFSRIIENYTRLNLIGSDIRIQKTLGGN